MLPDYCLLLKSELYVIYNFSDKQFFVENSAQSFHYLILSFTGKKIV